MDAGEERTEMLAVLALAGGERERPETPTVEAPPKGDEVRALRVIPGELDCGLDALGAGVR
jgi:hypothetical protein